MLGSKIEMERKCTSSWPWRKKLEKITSTAPTTSSLLLIDPSRASFDDSPSAYMQYPELQQYGQIRPPAEATTMRVGHGGSDETVEMLAKKIVDISSRLAAKDELANQQSRIAKDAVADLIKKDEQLKQHGLALKEEKSARVKAEDDCLSLKQELDRTCQQKGVVEARMMQLNGALKECMDEMQHAKDQLEQKAQETAFRNREWDKLKNELETENAELKRQLMEVTADNIAISKSLQERGRNLNEIIETRGKVESESKVLQVQIESLHKDMDAYKYEIHVLKKEIQIRNDEKEQNRKHADTTHKQHLESVKKIAKLESECNRLRALVRKKLPGPAVIAQMRVEGDHVGKKRLPSPKMIPDQRDVEALNGRLMAMEDETKLLKESLAKRTAELQVARQLCARSTSRLSSAESIIEAMARGQTLSASCSEENHATSLSHKCDSMQQQSFTLSPAPVSGGIETMEVMDWALSSEDGNNNDDELSSAESWASALIAELSQIKKDDGHPTMKTDENGKPSIRIIGPIVQDLDLHTALQELNTKLSSIGESILALPSSMRCMGNQGLVNEMKPLSFGMLGQLMEEFAFMKQLLVEVQKAIESEETNQGSNTNKTYDSSMTDACNEDVTLVESHGEQDTYMGFVRKIIEAVSVSADQSKQENLESGSVERVFMRLQMVADALNGGSSLHLSEAAAVNLLCNVGDLVKEHCIAAWTPKDVVGGQKLGKETGRSEIDMSVNEVTSGETVLAADNGIMSVTDESRRSVEIGTNIIVARSSYEALDGKQGSNVNVGDDGEPVVGETDNVSMLDVGKNGAHSAIDHVKFDMEESEGKLNAIELTLQMELLQQEVERLRGERDELAAKLAASQGQLEQQLARVATLDAESLLLASEKASMARELTETIARNQRLEEDLAEARASLDDLRQQVSSLTSALAEQAAGCQELQGSFMGLAGVGTSSKERTEVEANSEGKQRKEREIASAKAQLAECQRTILVLGSQLRTLSSAQDNVAAEQLFDSSLESASPTDQISLPPMAMAYGAGHVADRCSSRSRRVHAAGGYVRTRGGRLLSAEQYWGSSTGETRSPVAGGESHATPSHPSYSGRQVAVPRHMYSAACAQSPLHEYATEHSAYTYSPPETALSSPATSPARYNLQGVKAPPISKAPPNKAAATAAAPNKATATAAAAASGGVGFPPPSPARRASRIARFFARTKTVQ
ncbi:hypothetical protein L7F22_037467 [Adiantum nelumboides]|nr:hypothetical protein [Adiantum nelumboides]